VMEEKVTVKLEEDVTGLTVRGYTKGSELGRGTYGVVFEGNVGGRKVAMKKVRTRGKGIDFSFIREVKLLQELCYDHVLGLIDVFVDIRGRERNLWLVSEYMETDLKKIIDDRETIQLSAADCKSYMYMLLKGVQYLHANWILHRDLCPGNLLISPEGILKIGDFGLAKKFGGEDVKLTPEVVTRWYRAPELLLGARYYGKGVDMWSVGCIFAELMLRMPYFAGDNEIDQLRRIFGALGTPTPKQWQGMDLLPGYFEWTPSEGTAFVRLFTSATDDTLELLADLLKFIPSERPDAAQCLSKRYFSSSPVMTPPSQLVIRRPTQKPRPKLPEDGAAELRPDESSVTIREIKVEMNVEDVDMVTSPRAI